MKIDLDGIDQRILAVPMPPRRYVALQVGKAGTLLALELMPAPAQAGGENGPPAPATLSVHRYDLKTRKSDVPLSRSSKLHHVVRRREGAVPSRRRLDYRGPQADAERARGWSRARRLRRPERPAPTPLKTGNIEVRVDPIQEWKQMYHEAWHTERDWFYDRNIHGLDLKDAEKEVRAISSRRRLA